MDGSVSSSVERVQRLLHPVSAEARGGADPTLGDRFDRIQAEIAKLQSASNDGSIDWRMVMVQSEALLVGEAKDLRAAVYLAAAWHRLEGLAGLVRGLELLTGLLADFWNEVFPPLAKPALRAEVLTWLTDRVRVDLGGNLARADVEQVRATWSGFAKFREVVRSRFPERGPTLGPIEQAFALLPADKRPVVETATPTPPPLLEAAAAEDEILRPFPGDDPCGEDPRLCDEFEQLRVEIAKVGAVAAEEVAWPKVVVLSRKILATRSKDLRCLVWLAIARQRTEGSAGLADAIATLAASAERFGEALHPRRGKARAGAVGWFGERLQADLTRQPLVITTELLARARGDLARAMKALDGVCEDTNGLSLADEALSRVKPRGHTASAVARPTGAPAPPRPRPTTPPTGEAPSDAGIAEVVEALLGAARSRSAAGHEDATTLRLRRLALWMTPPEALQAKKHECDSGTPQQRAELTALAAAENWPELLQRCEIELESTPFWLDLTYWSIKAAEHVLGKDAAKTLKGELVALVMRNPTLLAGFDRKGQWLAAKEVRDWFARELTPRPPSATSTEPAAETPPADATAKPEAAKPVARSDDNPLPELPEDVQKLIEAKKLDDATTSASQWIAGAHGRARFTRSVAFAQQCLKAGSPKVAFPMFRALEGQLRKFTLTEWDPTLAVLCIRGYLASKMAVGVGLGAQDERLVDELALLDPKAMTGLLR
jgi:type VI secretion system protein VasJ